MTMRFHQRRFFAYPSGAPSLYTLSSVASTSYTLVTTDRSVSLLGYGDAGYSLHKLEVDDLRSVQADVVASAAIERPANRQTRVAVAYAVGEALFLQFLAPHHESLNSGEAAEASGCGKFELEASPTCMFSVQAAGVDGDVFYGVLVCCTDSIMAFGYVENDKESSPPASCSRLDASQFSAFFPEFAMFSHTILAVDTFLAPEKDQGWIAFGCADGFVRVFHGKMHGGCLGGPFETKDVQLNGPVTCVALFPKQTAPLEETSPAWRCSLLVTCAIGQAVVYEDLLSNTDEDKGGEVLLDSDTFDSIFAGIAADINLDGQVELLLGTDSQVTLAYKANETAIDHDHKRDAAAEEATKDSLESGTAASAVADGSSSPTSPASSQNIWSELETIPVADELVPPAPESLAAPRRRWKRLPRSSWDLETFGAIYSLLWRDVNHDGVPELLVASSTGIYVYEADPVFVIERLERVLSAVQPSASAFN